MLPLFDGATGLLLYAMIVFSPWAFGTTQPWSIWCMNVGGYALGTLLVAKVFVRGRVTGHSDVRTRRLTFALRVLTVCILGYILVSALNGEFTYIASEWRQEPHAHVDWLPHSLDRDATWQVFWNWLALACAFWAVHDWLLGEASPEGRLSNRRLQRLVFVLAANGALVAFQGILQQSSGTAKLLWFKVASNNRAASAQFGPYNYRSNAAQLFNLIWPAALGLWWHLQLRRPTQRHHWLLPCVMLLIAGPLVSLSRAGVAVALVQLFACGLLLLACGKFSPASRLGIISVFVLTVGVAAYTGGSGIAKRFQESAADPLVGRRETYELAKRMAADYPWFGVGPGAYDSTFQLYRNTPTDYWPA